MRERSHSRRRRMLSLIAAAAVVCLAGRALAKGSSTAERLTAIAADIDAVIGQLTARYPTPAGLSEQAAQQEELALSYLRNARKTIDAVEPKVDPAFGRTPGHPAANPLGDALKQADSLAAEAEGNNTAVWALPAISIKQDLHTAAGLIAGGSLLPAPQSSASPAGEKQK